MALPIGDVNLRFSCCTYLRYTGTTPSYCRKYDNIGEGGLLEYCRKDHQGYGGADLYQPQKQRRLTIASSLPWWHDDSNISMVNEERPQISSLLSVDLIKRDVVYHRMQRDPTRVSLNNEDSAPIEVDVIKNATGLDNKVENEEGKHQIKVFYDSGHKEEYNQKVESISVAVPPLDLFNETRLDELPSMISKPRKSKIQIFIDGSKGNVTQIELNRIK